MSAQANAGAKQYSKMVFESPICSKKCQFVPKIRSGRRSAKKNPARTRARRRKDPKGCATIRKGKMAWPGGRRKAKKRKFPQNLIFAVRNSNPIRGIQKNALRLPPRRFVYSPNRLQWGRIPIDSLYTWICAELIKSPTLQTPSNAAKTPIRESI